MSQTNQTKIYVPGYQDNLKVDQAPPSKENIIKISKECKVDSDCSWKITNCCSENSGGDWNCISKDSQIECNELVLCPQVLSPKPTISCSCSQGRCASG